MKKVMSSVLVGAIVLTGAGVTTVPVEAKEKANSDITVQASRTVSETRTYTTSNIPSSITYAKDGWVGILYQSSIEELGLGKYNVTFTGTVVRDPGFE
ncbi:hypothetical protein BK049_05430 [Bacillus xiamenensis]|uniref:Uncharacterized protein n=1 Tax=Bacillus xiamenensis TaxID=1178537 RepID=A0AAC9IIP3_9BACI|nr:hypothetical protein [Bacillus xiamenensis]AOZ88189.1 hypothetical protein BK049_05430 [Bacillus xiamenensis]EKF34809.1 hypothetical protein BA1_13436 [Bacillus xiamenensis]MBG9913219.1 hypothetical protein [Bacillus xiamenensis]MCW1837095.1 hypothetical protein [Bacillus xiamenensis]MCY9577608.1 hypothetical protein [Bacillus xiamenensis]